MSEESKKSNKDEKNKKNNGASELTEQQKKLAEEQKRIENEIEKNISNSVNKTFDSKKNLDKSNYESIIEANFIESATFGFGDIVDVVTNYYWTQNKPKETSPNLIASVPFLYAVEYKQKYGVTATNIFNNIYALSNAAKNISKNSGISNLYGNVSLGLKKSFDKLKDTIGTALDAVGGNNIIDSSSNAFSTMKNALSTIITNKSSKFDTPWIGNGFLYTELLYPYFHLYSLEATKKKFCFPYFTEGAASWQIANSFGDEGSQGLLSKTISSTLDSISNGMAKFAADVQDISSFARGVNQTGGFTMYNIEKAKAFSFPTGGRTISVKFPLFNTVKIGEWKKNYRFIVLFAIRNMLFRKNNVEYYPPLFYDVSIPGYGRMPLSYVKSFSVKPVGMTRIKNINVDFLSDVTDDGYQETNIIVPDAWVVQIDFESLIADSANQYLSSLVDLKINATLSI